MSVDRISDEAVKAALCEWFEDPKFVGAVIRAGIGKLMGDATGTDANMLGMLRYAMDGMPEKDGTAIAALVREHNTTQSEVPKP